MQYDKDSLINKKNEAYNSDRFAINRNKIDEENLFLPHFSVMIPEHLMHQQLFPRRLRRVVLSRVLSSTKKPRARGMNFMCLRLYH